MRGQEEQNEALLLGRAGTRRLTDSISGAELGAGVNAPSEPDAEGK